MKAEGKSQLEPPVRAFMSQMPSKRSKELEVSKEYHDAPKQKKQQKPQEPPLLKEFDERHLFIIKDQQDVLSENLIFTYVEINERLSKFVPDKVWRSKAAKRLTLNQKIELSLPS